MWLITTLVNLILGVTIFWRNPRSPVNRSFSVLVLLIALWTVANYFSDHTQILWQAIFWNRAIYFVSSFIATASVFFSIYFPRQKIFLDRKATLWLVGTGIGIGILSMFSKLLVKEVVFVGSRTEINFGPLFFAHSAYLLGCVGFSLFHLWDKYRKSIGLVRTQLGYVFLGFFISTFLSIITNVILPTFAYFELTSFGPSFMLIMVGFISYAITKHRLLDISVIISRALAEVLAVFFHGTIYLILVWFYVNYISAKIDFPFLVWTVAYGILVGQTHQSVRLFIQTTSDKVFLKGKYDYYKELSEISSRVTRTLSLENILSTLQRAFYEVIEVSNPRIYLWEDFDRPEVRELMEVKEMSFRGEDLVIPCRLEDRLIAIIVLGKKLSEDAYTDEDLRLLQVLANQTAVALDHTRTYEEIKQDYEASREKLLETERLLARSERIASLANLIREYNHEIKTPLAILRNELALLPDDPSLENFREKAIKAIERIKDIVESTLRLSDVGKRKIEDVNLNEVIEESLKLFPPSGVEVIKELSPLPTIKGDSDDLKMVLVNLIKNAVEAMPQGGELRLKSYTEQEQDKTYVILEVKDTGVGIPKENLEKIFEPFFSTHVTKGRGLGLSIVFRVVREHGGKIQVESELGKGSTFRVALPSF